MSCELTIVTRANDVWANYPNLLPAHPPIIWPSRSLHTKSMPSYSYSLKVPCGWMVGGVGWSDSDNRASLSSTCTSLPTGTELGNMKNMLRV